MPSFFYPWLAVAGVAAAAVPVIVHLLNRRRFRVVEWAAMDFLREAVTRSRRIIELRDLLLLLLRVLCLLAFGVAAARPYWSRSAQTAANPSQPVHAVLLVDNSLSMSYQKFDGILLDDAKAKARAIIEGLPHGSLISVLPVCGSARGVGFEAYARREDALDALAAIVPMDRSARPGPVIDLALEACRRVTTMSARQVFLFTDPQVDGWSAEGVGEQLKQLGCPIQVVRVAPDEIDNAWVADVRLVDGVADARSPAVFIAKIGYQGPAPRRNVQVTLKIDGTTASTRTVDLQPGQVREVQFPEFRFPAPAGGTTGYAAVEVALPHDRLPGDDQRSLVVPVTASLPVVFVDPQGADENPGQNRYGDTFWLRRLLAPYGGRADQEQPLIEVRKLKMEQLSRETLADARLVVVAGVPAPSASAVALLRQFVEQGGNVILAAGGGFDPAAWNKDGWSEGLGILPASLEPACTGRLREDPAGQSAPFVLDFDTLVHPYFRPEGASEEQLRGLFGPPTFFFKAAVPQCDERVQAQAAKAASDYFGRQRERLKEIEKRLAELDASGAKTAPAAAPHERENLLRERDELQPSWLGWRKAAAPGEEERSVEDLARRATPLVLGRYTSGVPMLVRRQWGRGQILFFSSSLSPEWTTMPDLGQSWWLMDRIVRDLLAETLPSWNLSSEGAFVMPVPVGQRSARCTLTDDDGQQQVLSVDALGSDRYGITLGNWPRRGVYRVSAFRASETEGDGVRLWEIPLAVNGPADESALAPLGPARAIAGQVSFTSAAAQESSVVAATLEGADVWKWLIALVLGLLLAELLLAAKSTPRQELAR